jgi:ABC-type sugar transport system permease subunit
MPHLTPVVAAIFIWLWLLNPVRLAQRGHLADRGVPHGTASRARLVRRPELALPALMAGALGRDGGNMMVIFLPGYRAPQELYGRLPSTARSWPGSGMSPCR